jgi:hypothetical protein
MNQTIPNRRVILRMKIQNAKLDDDWRLLLPKKHAIAMDALALLHLY